METYFTQITDYLLTQSWQIAILVVLIAAANLALKKRSAHVRYLLWLIVLAKCLVPPLLTVPLAVLPQERLSEPVSVSPLRMSVALEGVDRSSAEAAMLPASPTVIAPVPIVSEKMPRLTARQLLGLGWIVGATLFGLVAVTKALRTNFWLRRQRKLLPAEMKSGIEDLFSNVGVKSFPKVWLIDGIGQPFVWGLLRGSIYLPANFLKVDNAEHRRVVLGHELSHIVRFDAAVNLLQIIVQAVFWFHPFVWWSNKKIRAEREKCCDEMAIARLGAKARDYSSAIVNTLINEYESTRPVPSLAVAGPVKNIEERIKTIMKPGKKFHKHPSLVTATIILLLALLTVPTALVLSARAEVNVKTTPLHQAVAGGDIEQVRSLISKGVDVNSKDEKGQTALHAAVFQGRIDVILLLASNGADLDSKDKEGRTALSYAATIGSRVAVVQQLLALGADPNVADASGETPLHYGAKNGSPGGMSIVTALVAKGADINAKNNDGRTPAHVRVARGQGVYFLQLIKLGADLDAKDKDGNSVLHLAIDHPRPEAAERILAYDMDINQANAKGQTPLHVASRMGHKKLVEGLIAKGADVDGRDIGGYTALHFAAVNGHMDIAAILVDKGANVNMNTKHGHTPAYLAVRSFHSIVSDQLIKKGADISHICMASYAGGLSRVKDIIAGGISVNTKDEEGFAPLHAAAAGGRKDVIEYLLSQGAEPKGEVSAGWTALGYAAIGNHMETVELLRAKGIDAGTGVSELLPIVAGRGDIDAAKCLIALGADVNVNNGAPIYDATGAGHKAMVELLIASNANVNLRENWPPLSVAVQIDRPDIAACLIGAGADVDAGNWTALMQVPYSCKGTEMAELLIKAGADVNKGSSRGWTALHSVADAGEDITELLLRNGANPNAKGFEGRTPLHEAGWYSPSVIKVLVANGADVNARDIHGHTPLHFAYTYCKRDSVQQLVALGADINARTHGGETILHLAPTGGIGASAADFCEFLLAQGADINARDNSGWTPLHRAALLGKTEIVNVLLAHGADKGAKINDGKTPSDLAKENGHEGVLDLLRKHGAKE